MNTMDSFESETETSELYIKQDRSLGNDPAQVQKKKKKKKNKVKCEDSVSIGPGNSQETKTLKKSRKVVEEEEVASMTSTVRKQGKYVQLEERRPSRSQIRKFETVEQVIIKRKAVPSYQCCNHMSVHKKLFFSIFLSIISMTLFKEPPKINYPVAEFEQGAHEAVFEIVTDRKTRYIQFNLEIQKQVGPFVSTKVGRVKATVNYTLGYKFEKSRYSRGEGMHSVVEMSNLEILDYKISDVALENKSDGILNSWDFNDYENLVGYIQDKHIEQMKREALADITDQRRKMYESKAKLMLTDIIDKSESWFHWLLKRIDKYIDVGLEPYVRNVEIAINGEKGEK